MAASTPSRHFIARLYAAHTSESAVRGMRKIYHRQGEMSPHQREFLHQENSNEGQAADQRSANRSGRQRLPPAPKIGLCYEFNFDNISKGGKPLGCTIGKGSSKQGQHGQGVDMWVATPDQKGVAEIQAAIYLHPVSGVLMVAGMDANIPVVYNANGSHVPLQDGESHVILGQYNLLTIGDSAFCLEVPTYDPSSNEASYRLYTSARDRAMKKAGLSAPNRHLNSLPRNDQMEQFHHVVVHNTITEGAFGTILAGIDRCAGEPLGIKLMNIGGRRDLEEMIPELEVSCGLMEETQGLLQASALLCDKGCVVDCNKLKFTEDLLFCKHGFARIYMIMPLAIKDLDQVDWIRVPEGYVARVAIALLTGIDVLHDSGRIHRDISRKNALILCEKPVKAVLADFGKVAPDEMHEAVDIGPQLFHAPEVGRCKYDSKIDSWNAGLVICSMLVPTAYHKNIDMLKSPDKEAFCIVMREALEKVGQQSETESELSRITIGLIIIDPRKRWSVSKALNSMAKFMHDQYGFED
ncbi:MAG: hypothetical protein Q9174_003001 [Haloplaca sp. 1 TL-2023]